MNAKEFFGKLKDSFVAAVKKVYFFVFSPDALERATVAAEKVAEISEKLLPIVDMVAEWTPNKADDAIVDLLKRLNVQMRVKAGMSNEEKNAALKAAAVALARRVHPELFAKLDDATLYAAVDFAYKLYKDALKKQEVTV